MVDVHLTVSGDESVPLSVGESPSLPLALDVSYAGASLPDYTGETTVTPSGSTQTLETAGTSVRQDIVVEPVPSSYGLVSYDGSVLTIS